MEATVRSKSCLCSDATNRGKNHDSAALDDEVVIATAKVDAAELRDPQSPPLRPVERSQLFHGHYAMSQALQMTVGVRSGEIIEQEHGTAPPRKVLLERQDLAAIAERALCEQSDL